MKSNGEPLRSTRHEITAYTDLDEPVVVIFDFVAPGTVKLMATRYEGYFQGGGYDGVGGLDWGEWWLAKKKNYAKAVAQAHADQGLKRPPKVKESSR